MALPRRANLPPLQNGTQKRQHSPNLAHTKDLPTRPDSIASVLVGRQKDKDMTPIFDVAYSTITGRITITCPDGSRITVGARDAYKLALALNHAADQAQGGQAR